MLVSDIMTRSPRTVTPESSLIEVATIMCLYRIPALPVIDNGKLVGNISEMDILKSLFPSTEDAMSGGAVQELERMIPNYTEMMGKTTGDMMIKNPVSVSPDMHILKAAAIMTSRRFRRIPVSDTDGMLVGVMSLGDVHKAVFQIHMTKKAP